MIGIERTFVHRHQRPRRARGQEVDPDRSCARTFQHEGVPEVAPGLGNRAGRRAGQEQRLRYTARVNQRVELGVAAGIDRVGAARAGGAVKNVAAGVFGGQSGMQVADPAVLPHIVRWNQVVVVGLAGVVEARFFHSFHVQLRCQGSAFVAVVGKNSDGVGARRQVAQLAVVAGDTQALVHRRHGEQTGWICRNIKREHLHVKAQIDAADLHKRRPRDRKGVKRHPVVIRRAGQDARRDKRRIGVAKTFGTQGVQPACNGIGAVDLRRRPIGCTAGIGFGRAVEFRHDSRIEGDGNAAGFAHIHALAQVVPHPFVGVVWPPAIRHYGVPAGRQGRAIVVKPVGGKTARPYWRQHGCGVGSLAGKQAEHTGGIARFGNRHHRRFGQIKLPEDQFFTVAARRHGPQVVGAGKYVGLAGIGAGQRAQAYRFGSRPAVVQGLMDLEPEFRLVALADICGVAQAGEGIHARRGHAGAEGV